MVFGEGLVRGSNQPHRPVENAVKSGSSRDEVKAEDDSRRTIRDIEFRAE
jgi:hypothetical protein